MDGAKQMLWNIFYALVRPSTREQRKCGCLSSIIITIILYIYLQVSKTDGLAELHWVIEHSVLQKIN